MKTGISQPICKVLASFMEDRFAEIKMGEETSRRIRVRMGVPQGSKLGPHLYSLYVGDVEHTECETQGAVHYADDEMSWFKTERLGEMLRAAKKEMEKVNEQLKEWSMKVNPTKSKFLIINERGSKIGETLRRGVKEKGLKADGEKVEIVDEIKYLGIWINDELSATKAIDHAIKKSNTAFGLIGYLLKKKSLDVKVKMTMYRTLIRPTMLYGAEVWRNITAKDTERLMIKERKFLRTITGLRRRDDLRYYPNATLYEAAKMKDTIDIAIPKAKERYQRRKEQHPNQWFVDRCGELEKRRIERIKRDGGIPDGLIR